MRPLFLLLAAALAAPAAALDQLDASYEPSEAVGVCLGGYPDLRQWVHAYDEETREEFYSMYRAYAAMVLRRRNEGWSNGNLGNLRTNLGGRHALQWENSRTALERERDQLRTNGSPEAAQEIEEALNARFGTCNDWARETQDTLRGLKSKKFEIHDRVKDGMLGTGMGAHAFTLVCPRGITRDRCIGFDPWKNGLPELYKGTELESSGTRARGCFADSGARAQLGAN